MLDQAPDFTARAVYMQRQDGLPIELVEMISAPVSASPGKGLGVQRGLVRHQVLCGGPVTHRVNSPE
jgi:hypothetical protein